MLITNDQKLELTRILGYNSSMAEKQAKKSTKIVPPIARQSDGAVQITFTIAWSEIATEKEKTIKEMASEVEVPGFRKGKAPLEKVEARLDKQHVLEHTLGHILPKLFSNAIKEHRLRPAIYPKFELVSAEEGKDWQVVAKTAEIPEFSLGDYEKVIKDASKGEIWTPGKGDPDKKVEPSREQKESAVIGAISQHYKFELPKMLIEEEVNSRLSSLLERIEKLGLSLESYLASVKKTAEQLRGDYEADAERAIRLDIVLGAIAEKEGVSVAEEETVGFINAAKASSQEISESQKGSIRSFLVKRKVLERLSSMV